MRCVPTRDAPFNRHRSTLTRDGPCDHMFIDKTTVLIQSICIETSGGRCICKPESSLTTALPRPR
eukprot:28946-Hanusia_phi.AAC.1